MIECMRNAARKQQKNQEAISILRHMSNLLTTRAFEEDALEVAIQTLNEVEEYRAIGTPEECRAAMEKQTDEKPTAVLGTFGGTEYECKNCGSDVCYGDEYCRWCGQKLDWSDGE